MEEKLKDLAAKLPQTHLELDAIAEKQGRKKAGLSLRTPGRIAVALAVCLALMVGIGLGWPVLEVDAEEYKQAVAFFDEHDLPTEGLSRREICKVYRDITTKSFTYSKTAEVIESSLISDPVSGFEILQEEPTPQDIENLWNYKNYNGWFFESEPSGISYNFRHESTEEDLCAGGYFEKYDGETLLWTTEFLEFWVDGQIETAGGVIVYGEKAVTSSAEREYGWIAKIDDGGKVLWKARLESGFEDEYVCAVLENKDGGYAVISRGDLKHFCLSQYSAEGEFLHRKITRDLDYGFWDATTFGDGYIVQLGNNIRKEFATIAMVDREGNITKTLTYESDDAMYRVNDMIEFNGKIYLSAYAVPNLAEDENSYGGRDEIAPILGQVFESKDWDIPSEELTPMVRQRYSAVLLVCDPDAGAPQEFYTVKGSLGGKLAVSDEGELLWDVESITRTFFSLGTSSFTIGGTCYVFRYTFDDAGRWIGLAKTNEITDFRR